MTPCRSRSADCRRASGCRKSSSDGSLCPVPITLAGAAVDRFRADPRTRTCPCRRRHVGSRGGAAGSRRRVRVQIAERVKTNYQWLMANTVASSCTCRRASGGWARRAAGADDGIGRGSRRAAPDQRRVLYASRIFFRLSSRVLSRGEPFDARDGVSATASLASCGTSIATSSARRPLPRDDVSLETTPNDRYAVSSGPPPGGTVDPALLISLHDQLGHRRHRRHRCPWRRGWPQRVSASCSSCRSTSGRQVSSRPTRRSARWRSIRCSSRLPDVPDFDALGGEASLSAGDRERLDTVRRSPRASSTRWCGR